MSKFEIRDIDEFTESARRIVFSSFGKANEETKDDFTDLLDRLSEEEEAEMNDILSYKESKLIVESLVHIKTHKKTKKSKYIVSEKIFSDILEALNARLVSNMLSNLTKKGLIESAYDDELNDFVFWIQEDDQEKKQNNKKPEAN